MKHNQPNKKIKTVTALLGVVTVFSLEKRMNQVYHKSEKDDF